MAEHYQMSGPVPDKGGYIVGTAVAAAIVTTITVALRCCSRRLTKAGFWWDDWVIIASLVRQPTFSPVKVLSRRYSHLLVLSSAHHLVGNPSAWGNIFGLLESNLQLGSKYFLGK